MPETGAATLPRARVLWGAMLVALVLYYVVLVVLLGKPSPAGGGRDPAVIRYAFLFLTAADVGVILFFRRQLPPADAAPIRPTPDPQAMLTTYVVCWALSEAVALYGLVLGFLARSLDEAQPFFIVGAALLLWQRPRADHFR